MAWHWQISQCVNAVKFIMPNSDVLFLIALEYFRHFTKLGMITFLLIVLPFLKAFDYEIAKPLFTLQGRNLNVVPYCGLL